MCGKTKINILLMYKVLDEDTIKPEILPQLSVAKRVCVSEGDLAEVVPCVLQVESLAVNDRLLLLFHDVVLVVSNIPHNRSRWPLQAYMFSVSLPTRACLRHIFLYSF